MYEHSVPGEQPKHEIFFGFERWHLHHRVPAALGAQRAAGRNRRDLRCQDATVGAHAIRDLRSDARPACQELRRRDLHRRRDRQVGVAEELEPLQAFAHQPIGARNGDPSELDLRKPGRFGQASEAERKGVPQLHGPTASGRGAGLELVLREHLVSDDRNPALLADGRQPLQLVARNERAGRVVGADDEHRARAERERALQALEVDIAQRP